MADKKIIERIEKLVRLANSTTFDKEKESAALEVVRLLGKHKVDVEDVDPSPPPPRRTQPSHPQVHHPYHRPSPSNYPATYPAPYSGSYGAFSVWTLTRLDHDVVCSMCGNPIPAGWECYEHTDGRYLHEDGNYCT